MEISQIWREQESLREGILTYQMTKYADDIWQLIWKSYVFLLVIVKKPINACNMSQIRREIFSRKNYNYAN